MVLEPRRRRCRRWLLYSGAMRITVMEPFHSVFYAPHYVALHLGHFTAEGLDVTTRTGAGSTSTTRALIDGSAQISLGGLMRSLDLADRGGRLLPHFAEVNSRNGFFLVGRQSRARFAWPEIVGRTVISFTGAPTPYQSMRTVLRREGVDPARVTFVRDLAPADAVTAFRGGRGDFIEVGQPTDRDPRRQGRGRGDCSPARRHSA